MTKPIKPFIERLRTKTTPDNSSIDDTDCELNEGLLRSVSAIALVNKLRKLKGQIKIAKTTDQKLELLADQNLTQGMLMFAMTQFTAGKK